LIRIGSRGSQLALWQANHIAEALRALGHEVSIEIIRTTGDRMQNIAFASVGRQGNVQPARLKKHCRRTPSIWQSIA